MAGFPNFFIISGPNTGLGHSSLVLMIESQVSHIMSAIRTFVKKRASFIEVRSDVEQRYNERLQTRLERSVWASGCTSWYQTRTGRNTTLWPNFTFVFRLLTRRAKTADYCFTVSLERYPTSCCRRRTALAWAQRTLQSRRALTRQSR